MTHPKMLAFLEKLESIIEKREFIKLTLTNKRIKDSILKRIIISPVEIKKTYCLNFVYRNNTNDITKNFDIAEGYILIESALENEFLNAEIFALNENINLTTLPNGKIQIKYKIPTLEKTNNLTHDRTKERLIDTKENIYLRELGITNGNWELRREMSNKYLQINKYIELLKPNINDLKISKTLHIVDMGSGKGYLTFALYDYLTNNLKLDLQMTGVEFREELVNTCNLIAIKANFNDLKFIKGTIEETKLEKIDILIALHACDTATDDAIYRGIKSNAALIVCAPCCHKQIRKAMNVTNELSEITNFGILKERQAEILTDTLRAMILEVHGYKTNVFEFISSEHTPKNVMIVGRKTNSQIKNKKQIIADIQSIKATFGIEKHYLETLLEM